MTSSSTTHGDSGPLMNRLLTALTGTWLMLRTGAVRNERGGTGGGIESLLLIAGAIVVAGLVIAGVTVYVQGHMP